jgi:hypothetical protein
MFKQLLTSGLALLVLSVHAQKVITEHEAGKFYSKNANEFIFSWGNVNEDSSSNVNFPGGSVNAEPVIRFSAFFNSQEQFHYDFNNALGFYTGIGVRNVGFINNFGDSIKVKQRQYTLGVPLALKLGSLRKGFYLAFGGELELFFNYKQKVFYNNSKAKFSEWFSSKNANLINPSVFAELNFKQGQYIRFRYYINDFLKENRNGINYNSGKVLPYDFTPSQLMYISIGTAIDWDDFKKSTNKSSSLKASLN